MDECKFRVELFRAWQPVEKVSPQDLRLDPIVIRVAASWRGVLGALRKRVWGLGFRVESGRILLSTPIPRKKKKKKKKGAGSTSVNFKSMLHDAEA